MTTVGCYPLNVRLMVADGMVDARQQRERNSPTQVEGVNLHRATVSDEDEPTACRLTTINGEVVGCESLPSAQAGVAQEESAYVGGYTTLVLATAR